MTYDEMKKMLGNGFNQKETIEVLQMLQGNGRKDKSICFKAEYFVTDSGNGRKP